jgi:hypothetical protein
MGEKEQGEHFLQPVVDRAPDVVRIDQRSLLDCSLGNQCAKSGLDTAVSVGQRPACGSIRHVTG